MLAGVSLFPQALINVRLPEGTDWEHSPTLVTALAAVEGELSGQGRVLIRASGTEPVLRVMVEASDAGVARRAAERLAQAAVASA
jgi:phosphoglucosamine mutase